MKIIKTAKSLKSDGEDEVIRGEITLEGRG
jgi:hypothetical protein